MGSCLFLCGHDKVGYFSTLLEGSGAIEGWLKRGRRNGLHTNPRTKYLVSQVFGEEAEE